MSIIKQQWKRTGYVNAPISSIRELGEEIIGELDTATSFMYLFRRFGTPQATNADEYKILYSYDLKYKDMFFSIHASYYKHVYFNAMMPEKEWKNHVKEWKIKVRELANETLKKGICFMPYSRPHPNEFEYLTKSLRDKNEKIFDEKGKEFFSEEDYKFLCEYEFKDDIFGNQPYYDKIKPFYDSICKEFRDTFTNDELDLFSESKIEHYPELYQQCKEFFHELLRGYHVRDVPINIRGYESEENKITKYEEE